MIKELENSEYNFGEFKTFLDYIKEKNPELIDGVENLEDFKNIIQNVEPIMNKIFPQPLLKDNLKAITFPFSDQFLFKTERLKKLMDGKKYQLIFNTEKIDYETIYKYCCIFVLSKYYKINLGLNLSNQLEIENAGSYKTYLATDYNTDYITIYPSSKKYELSEEELDLLLNNYDNTDLWLEKVPVGSWILKGFNLVTFFDNTTEIALSNLKTKLISYKESFEDFKTEMVDSFMSIFRVSHLEVGFSSYNSDKYQFEPNHFNHKVESIILNNKKHLQIDRNLLYEF